MTRLTVGGDAFGVNVDDLESVRSIFRSVATVKRLARRKGVQSGLRRFDARARHGHYLVELPLGRLRGKAGVVHVLRVAP